MSLVLTDTPEKLLEKCALDIIGPLPVTTEENMIKLIRRETQEVLTIVKAFVVKVIMEHKIPEKILTD